MGCWGWGEVLVEGSEVWIFFFFLWFIEYIFNYMRFLGDREKIFLDKEKRE